MENNLNNINIHFSPVTPDNWRIFKELKVKREQGKFVASNVTILARAFAFRNFNSCVYAIYNKDVPVGMLMQRDYEDSDKKICVLDQFMIDKQHQGKGFGKAAMQLWLSMVKSQNKYDSVILCYIQGDEAARNLYSKLGFNHNGEIDENEIYMEYNLK